MSYVDAGYTIVLATLAALTASILWRERVAHARAERGGRRDPGTMRREP
jgi:hypothetical protein